ncbi:hypothetical protein [Ensifer sp. 22460]|uniref:hypothetical protein n=1 Tax=Ensifer sp. 22460 TaxID=3453922 RepID=UPI003F84790C
MFEIAFNPKTQRACAIYEAVSEMDFGNGHRRLVVANDPLWVTAATPHTAVNFFFQALIEQSDDA